MATRLTQIRRIIISILFLSLAALAQTSTVSGTVVDASSQAWVGGTYTLTFFPSPTNPSIPIFQGSTTFTKVFTGTLGSGGAYSIPNVPRNDYISPFGSQYVLKVCPNATFQCFNTQPFSIASSTYTANVEPPPISITVAPSTFNVAYSDSEIGGGSPGSFYFNSTDGSVHYCSTGNPCSSWAVLSAAGPGVNPTFGNLTAASLNGVLNAAQFSGADAGAKIAACLAALGTRGGVCDARTLTGAQTVSEDIFASAAGPDVVRFGAATYTFSVPQVVSNWTRLRGDVFGGTTFVFTPTTGAFITWDTPMASGGDGAGSLQLAGQGISNIRIEGPTHADPDIGILLGGSASAIGVEIESCVLNYWGTAIQFANNAYDDTVAHSAIEWNGTGVLFPSGITNSGEKIQLLDNFIADSPSNLPGVDIEGSGANFIATGDSFDFLTNAITMGSGSAGGTFTCLGCHFEDDSVNFIEAAAGNVSIYGGSWIFDATTGTAASMVNLSGSASLEIQGVSIETLGVTVTDFIAGSTTGTVAVANDQIAVGNFTNIEATAANGFHFGFQQLGITGLGGAFANNGIIVGPQDCGQGFHWTAFGAVATDPYVCQATGANATELEFGTNGAPVFEISSAGLALPSSYTVGIGGQTITQPAVSGTLALSGANGSSRGTITISAATSGSHPFAAGYSSAPICNATPVGTTPPATALSYWVSSTTSAVTITLSASGTATFNWSCGPAIN